jgi:hypothetical protein
MGLTAAIVTAATSTGATLGLAVGWIAAYQFSDLERNTSLIYLAAGAITGGATLGLLAKAVVA